VLQRQCSGGQWTNEMNEELTLLILDRKRIVLLDFEKIDTIDLAGRVLQRIAACGVATAVNHRGLTSWLSSKTRRSCVRRTVKQISTNTFSSSLSTLTSSTRIRSPSHCCISPCAKSCVAAANSLLLGAKTKRARPLPKLGRLTRSPGAVNSTCS